MNRWQTIELINPLTIGNSWRRNGKLVSNVTADALVLKHQAISIHNTGSIPLVWHQFHKKLLLMRWIPLESNIQCEVNDPFNPSPPGQNDHFADDIFRCIFLNENAWISFKISLKFVPEVWINNVPALVQMKAWYQPGDKPSFEPMICSLLMHICVAWPLWVKGLWLWRQSPDQTISLVYVCPSA